MFKKIAFILSIALTLHANSRAQKLTLDWGPETEEIKRTHVVSILGMANDKYYVHRAKDNGKGQYLEIYDKSNHIISSSEILMTSKQAKDAVFQDMKLLNGVPVIFYSFYNKKLEKNFAFANKVDDKGNLIGEPNMIDEIAAEKKRNAGNFDFILSKDSTKILIFRNDPFEKHANESFNMKVIDKNLQTVWEKHVTMPVEDEDFRISDATVTNDGKVYVLARFQHGTRTKKEGKPTYKYFIYAYSSEDKQPVQYEISLGDKFITDISFEVDKATNNLLCAGFYSNKNASDIAGTFFLRLNGSTKEVLKKGIKDFNSKFLANFMSERKAEKGNTELEHFKVLKILTQADGSGEIVAEQRWDEWRTYTTYNNGRMSTYSVHEFYSNNIIAMKINADGTFGWISVIPKRQMSTGVPSIYNYFGLVQYNNILFFIYNDDPKNLEKDTKEIRQTSIRKAVAVLGTIDQNGNVGRQELFSNKDNKVILCPYLQHQTLDNEIEIYAEKGKYFKFGNISLK